MINSRLHTRRPGRAAPAALVLLVCLLGGCQERIPSPDHHGGETEPRVPHSTVTRDLAEIRGEGVLRMAAHYNSSGYFIHRGGQAGFDYELLEAYARTLGVILQVVLPEPGEDLVSLVNAGRADVAAGDILQDARLDAWVAATRPVDFVRKVVVYRKGSSHPGGLAGLAGLRVALPRNDPFLHRLREIRDKAPARFLISLGPEGMQAEDLLIRLGAGEYDAVVVSDGVATAAMAYLPGLEIGPRLTDRIPTVWLTRHDSPDLRASLNRFLRKHIRIGKDGNVRRSQMYGVIHDRYFKDTAAIRRLRAPAHRPERSGRISPYDELIRTEADPLDLDWRMIAALIYQESRFSPTAQSKAGARGLMQLLPTVAGIPADSLFDVRANIRSGLKLLNTIYGRYSYLDSLDRWRFTLAEYHAGHGHVTDARRIAMDLGRDPNRWRGSLAETLPLLMRRKYYQETRYGFYRGGETVAYVEEILNRYRMYSRLVHRDGPAPPPEAAPDSVAQDTSAAAHPRPD